MDAGPGARPPAGAGRARPYGRLRRRRQSWKRSEAQATAPAMNSTGSSHSASHNSRAPNSSAPVANATRAAPTASFSGQDGVSLPTKGPDVSMSIITGRGWGMQTTWVVARIGARWVSRAADGAAVMIKNRRRRGRHYQEPPDGVWALICSRYPMIAWRAFGSSICIGIATPGTILRGPASQRSSCSGVQDRLAWARAGVYG